MQRQQQPAFQARASWCWGVPFEQFEIEPEQRKEWGPEREQGAVGLSEVGLKVVGQIGVEVVWIGGWYSEPQISSENVLVLEL